MVEVIYKTSDGTGYNDQLEAYRNEVKWLRNRRDTLCSSLRRMKQEHLPRRTKNYLNAREKARARRESICKNLIPERRWVERQAYFEALAEKFKALDNLQTEIRVYKKLRAEYKEKAKEYKKVFAIYKAVEEGREMRNVYLEAKE